MAGQGNAGITQEAFKASPGQDGQSKAITGKAREERATMLTCSRRLTTSSGYATVCPVVPATAPHASLVNTLSCRSSSKPSNT